MSPPVPFDPAAALGPALAAYAVARDIVDERPVEGELPRWCTERGWDGFLASLSDREVAQCESHGLVAAMDTLPAVPASLRELGQQVREATRLERVAEDGSPAGRGSVRRVGLAKRAQLDGLIRLCVPHVRRARRALDVGSGHGHVARWMAELFGIAALGWERDAARVRTAEQLVQSGASVRYQVVDVLREAWELGPGDLALGLHACGELGDVTTEAVARARCGLVLIGCCAQKLRGEVREPLSAPARSASLRLSRSVLGLANLSSRELGVAGTIEEVMAARQTRLGLRLLLRGRGLAMRAGEEMRGVNRRRAYGSLAALAEAALQGRGLAPPNPAELAHVEQDARQQFACLRRLSLPRNMLGRLLEVLLALDRAARLAEAGLETSVVTAFDEAASPRNIAVVAEAPAPGA